MRSLLVVNLRRCRWPDWVHLRKATAGVAAWTFAQNQWERPALAEQAAPDSLCEKHSPKQFLNIDDFLGDRWMLRKIVLPGEATVEMLEGRFVFIDGTGVRIWPASLRMVEYLRTTGFGSDRTKSEKNGVEASWSGRKVLELGCGCGLVAVALARWGAMVVGTDISLPALALADANAERHIPRKSKFLLRQLDWTDLTACERLREELGPFDAILVTDGVLVAPPSGPMWRDSAENMAAPPGPVLDATMQLGRSGAEIIFAVTERSGDVQATARALLERRQWLQLLGPPVEVPMPEGEAGSTVTVFHFRWKAQAGVGGDVTRKLWKSF